MTEHVYSKMAVDLLTSANVARRRDTDGSVEAVRSIGQHLDRLRRASAELELYEVGALEYVITDGGALEAMITPYGLSEGKRLSSLGVISRRAIDEAEGVKIAMSSVGVETCDRVVREFNAVYEVGDLVEYRTPWWSAPKRATLRSSAFWLDGHAVVGLNGVDGWWPIEVISKVEV